jgi:hypothetical protein
VVLHNHLQLSFQSLSLHCRPHYWWSGAGLDLWSEAISGSYRKSAHIVSYGETYAYIASENLESSTD